ncbi:MAG TPA: hypothetical protein P5280_11295 [Cyclobacteriaceae bacterium]|nr:hypothetical protein [Cyclobacteriaceae bacterium]
MKKIHILSILFVAVTAFGFVSYQSMDHETPSDSKSNELTVLKGAEKSGFSESNQNW